VMAGSGLEVWVAGGWGEELREMRPPGPHEDIDLFLHAPGFHSLDDKLPEYPGWDEIVRKRWSHKRAWFCRDVIEEDPEYGAFAYFNWPPIPKTIHLTLAEAHRLSSSGVTLNIFMLEDDPSLVKFMSELARRTGGRVFQTAGQDLGHFVLKDFVKRRR